MENWQNWNTAQTKEEALESLKVVQERIKEEDSFSEKMRLKDVELELKRVLGLIVPPKDGEECISCSG